MRNLAVICLLMPLVFPAFAVRAAQAAEPTSQPTARPATEKHWAFQPLLRPATSGPSSMQPENEAVSGTARNAIDYFVRDQLSRQHLRPAREADRTTLLRRVTLTLTGLPPTLNELDTFLNDTSPDAYERVVDRLLASPHYGERMAQTWLDLARYADTHGYHADTHRDMWRWRDWVIEAFNRDLPFDEFTVEQLAGDLLPRATLDQRLATGFNRNHMINFEDGSIAEEFRTEYVADRVTTVGTVWLGQTLQCARCHDHKHDPFTQRDFYQLFAFFNNVPENGLDGQKGNAQPFLAAPTREQQRRLAELRANIRRNEQEIEQRITTVASTDAAWEQRMRSGTIALPVPPGDMRVHLPFDEREGTKATNIRDTTASGTISGDTTWLAGKLGQALLLDAEQEISFPPNVTLNGHAPFSLALWLYPTTDDEMSIVSAFATDNRAPRGFELSLQQQQLRFCLQFDERQRHEIQTTARLELRKWQHVAVQFAGSEHIAKTQIFINGQPCQATTLATVTGSSPRLPEAPLRIGRNARAAGFRGLIDELRIYDRLVSAEEIALIAGQNPISELLLIPAARRTPQQQQAVVQFYLETTDRAFRERKQSLTTLRRELENFQATLPTSMVMDELPQPRDTHILTRGLFDQPAEAVQPGVPAVLPPLKSRGRATRLDLARWLVQDAYPLTARVTVNRIWQHHFSHGLVATADDFGTHGSPPSHPELLDWLASELRSPSLAAAPHWSQKHLHRVIVTSATFRQSGRWQDLNGGLALPPSFAERGADMNRWLARFPSQRLTAETLRDLALASSGLMNRAVGGPSIFPYQPAGLWEEVAYDTKSFTAQSYRQSHGADLYRRGLYVFWKRAVPPPALAIWDAPDREVCSVGRPTSNTPLQALVVLNETTQVESAKKFAERALRTAPRDAAKQIAFLFRTATSRTPSDSELEPLLLLFAAQKNEFARDPTAARKLLTTGEASVDATLDPIELASLTVVANLVLALDETMTMR